VALEFTLAYFAHAIRSDWNNGNAHFLRGLLDNLRNSGTRSPSSSLPTDGQFTASALNRWARHLLPNLPPFIPIFA
jgi:hypothetical protein